MRDLASTHQSARLPIWVMHLDLQRAAWNVIARSHDERPQWALHDEGCCCCQHACELAGVSHVFQQRHTSIQGAQSTAINNADSCNRRPSLLQQEATQKGCGKRVFSKAMANASNLPRAASGTAPCTRTLGLRQWVQQRWQQPWLHISQERKKYVLMIYA